MDQRMNPLTKIAARSALAGFLATAALMGGIQLQAQAIAAHNSNAPVDFASDRIELQDRENRVVLSGNVVINQANLQLRASRTLLNYTDAGSLSIQRIMATGGVNMSRGNETASGDTAVYDFNRRIITMAGNVRLRRGGDTLNGGRLTIDLVSGVSSVDGSAGSSSPVAGEDGVTSSRSSGRVTGSFSVPQ